MCRKGTPFEEDQPLSVSFIKLMKPIPPLSQTSASSRLSINELVMSKSFWRSGRIATGFQRVHAWLDTSGLSARSTARGVVDDDVTQR